MTFEYIQKINNMKKTLLSVCMLCLTAVAMAQPAGGFGGVQQQTKLETSQEWKDINYVGDDQTYHTCDIYLPKEQIVLITDLASMPHGLLR